VLWKGRQGMTHGRLDKKGGDKQYHRTRHIIVHSIDNNLYLSQMSVRTGLNVGTDVGPEEQIPSQYTASTTNLNEIRRSIKREHL
jgi:hypothetical protein